MSKSIKNQNKNKIKRDKKISLNASDNELKASKQIKLDNDF